MIIENALMYAQKSIGIFTICKPTISAQNFVKITNVAVSSDYSLCKKI